MFWSKESKKKLKGTEQNMDINKIKNTNLPKYKPITTMIRVVVIVIMLRLHMYSTVAANVMEVGLANAVIDMFPLNTLK